MHDPWLPLIVVWALVALGLWLWLEFSRRNHDDWW